MSESIQLIRQFHFFFISCKSTEYMGITSHKPLVSTLICTYNAASFFDATIRSVLAQTYENQEILIRDDWSKDNTVNMLKKRKDIDSRISVYTDPSIKRWAYWWLNFLLDKASWTYIAIQDHDDIWHPEKLEKQVNFLETHTIYDWCWSAYTIYIELYNKLTKKNIIWNAYGKGICHHTSLIYRNTEKRYNTSLIRFIDLDFMLHSLWPIHELPEVLMMHRERADWKNLFSQRSRWFINWLKLATQNFNIKKAVYYLYRSLVGEYLVRYFSINLFSRNIYTDIHTSKHTRLRDYIPKK